MIPNTALFLKCTQSVCIFAIVQPTKLNNKTYIYTYICSSSEQKCMYIDRLGRNAAVNLHSQYYTKGVKRTTTEKIKYKRNKRQNTKVNCIEIDPKKNI